MQHSNAMEQCQCLQNSAMQYTCMFACFGHFVLDHDACRSAPILAFGETTSWPAGAAKTHLDGLHSSSCIAFRRRPPGMASFAHRSQ